jgi:hypothetical protein
MPKFDLDINGVDQDAFDGYAIWDGPLPTDGIYDGKLKVAKILVIDADGKNHSKNQGKNRVNIGVELAGNVDSKKPFNGYVAFGGVNLVESGIGFVNQWLRALTDGSEEEFTEIKKAFYEGGIRVDEKKEHITAIGRWKVESPEGELPIKVALKQRSYTTTNGDQSVTKSTVDIATFLTRDGGSSASTVDEEPAAEPEDAEVDLDDIEGDDATPVVVDESVFDAEPTEAPVG